MSFHIPTQERAVDPYSSYNSDNVNRLTRVISKGWDVVVKGLQTGITSTTSVQVTSGVAIKDDVMIDIQETLNIDLTNGTWFVEGTPIEGTTYYYVVLEYRYQKVIPAPVSDIRILKTRSNFNPVTQMFLNCLRIQSGQVVDVLDYDPENPNIVRRGATVLVQHTNSLPPWSSGWSGVMFVVNGGEYIAIGGESDWLYFRTDSTSTTYVTYNESGSLPTWDSSYRSKIYVTGGVAYLGGPSGWLNLTEGGSGSGVTSLNSLTGSLTLNGQNGINVTPGGSTITIQGSSPSSIDGVSAPGSDIDLIAGANITITPNNVAKTITISSTASGGSTVGWEVDSSGDLQPLLPTIFEPDGNCDMMPGDGDEFQPDLSFELDVSGDIQPKE